MTGFQLDDLEHAITEKMRLYVADLILRWAAFDTAISYWMVLEFGLQMDTASIIIGNMDTKSKLDKLYKLHDHQGMKTAASISRLRKQHELHVQTRNIVAHQRCAGFLKSDPEFMVFHSTRHIKGIQDEFQILCVPLSDIGRSTAWAKFAEETVRKITDATPYRPGEPGQQSA